MAGTVPSLEQLLGEQVQVCRVCSQEGGDLIAPCQCAGRLRRIHRACLRASRVNGSEYGFYNCERCDFAYQLRTRSPRGWDSRHLRMRLILARDIVTVAALLQALLIGLSATVYALDSDGDVQAAFPPGVHPIAVYYTTGVVFGLFVAVSLTMCYAITPSLPFDAKGMGGMWCPWWHGWCQPRLELCAFDAGDREQACCDECCAACLGDCDTSKNRRALRFCTVFLLIVFGGFFALQAVAQVAWKAFQRHVRVVRRRLEVQEQVVLDLNETTTVL